MRIQQIHRFAKMFQPLRMEVVEKPQIRFEQTHLFLHQMHTVYSNIRTKLLMSSVILTLSGPCSKFYMEEYDKFVVFPWVWS